jgi:uncharacterized protein YjbI with pentapeptide repeats
MMQRAYMTLMFLAACAAGVFIGLAVRAQTTAPSVAGLSPAQLQNEKLRQEVRQLQLGNAQGNSLQHTLLAWAPFVTAFAAIAAVGATLWKQANDMSAARVQLNDEHTRARAADEQWRERFIEDRRRSLAQEEAESLRRFDVNIATVITNLGSESETLQVNAAAAFATYLKPRYKEFHADLLAVLIANLRLGPSSAVGRVLKWDLERLLRMMFREPACYGDDLSRELDLTRAALQRFDISGIDFGDVVVDAAFADLAEARLIGARLFRLRGYGVSLERAYCSRAILTEARLNGAKCRGALMHEANLVSATFKDADLSGVKFHRALLQEAHLEGASLVGADFTGANLANTYFRGAVFDRAALRSIARGAKRWRDNNNFDDTARQAMLALSDDAAHSGPPVRHK